MAKFSVIVIILETVNYPVFLRTLVCKKGMIMVWWTEEEWRAGITAARRAGFGIAEIAAGRRLISFCLLRFYAPRAEGAAL